MKVRAKAKSGKRFAGFFGGQNIRDGVEFEIPEKQPVLDERGKPTGKFEDVPRFNEKDDAKALKKHPELKGLPRAFSPRWMEKVEDPKVVLKKKAEAAEQAAKDAEATAKQTKAEGDVQNAADLRAVADAAWQEYKTYGKQ